MTLDGEYILKSVIPKPIKSNTTTFAMKTILPLYIFVTAPSDDNLVGRNMQQIFIKPELLL
jgi:hypothetical protein